MKSPQNLIFKRISFGVALFRLIHSVVQVQELIKMGL